MNLDIQFGGEDTTEVADHSSAVLGTLSFYRVYPLSNLYQMYLDVKFLANELIHQVANIRNELRLQRVS